MYQAYARTCNFFDSHDCFYLQLHAILGTFYSSLLVNVYASVIVHADEHLHDSTAALE